MTCIKKGLILLTTTLTLAVALNANARPECHRSTEGSSETGNTCEQGTWYEATPDAGPRCNLRSGEDVPMKEANGGC